MERRTVYLVLSPLGFPFLRQLRVTRLLLSRHGNFSISHQLQSKWLRVYLSSSTKDVLRVFSVFSFIDISSVCVCVGGDRRHDRADSEKGSSFLISASALAGFS